MEAFTVSRNVLKPDVVCGSTVARTIFKPGLAAFRAKQYVLRLATKVEAPSPWSFAPRNRKSTFGPVMGANHESIVAEREVTVAMPLPETASLPPCGKGLMPDDRKS